MMPPRHRARLIPVVPGGLLALLACGVSARAHAAGLAIFGDGHDGDVTLAADTTLSRDMYFNRLIVPAGVVLNTNGSRRSCIILPDDRARRSARRSIRLAR
jgi:hypothetical protein